MTFKIKRIQNEQGQMIWCVYPKGYDYGRGFSTLEKAFDYMNLIIKNQ